MQGPNVLILIAGFSCSGKTTLANRLAKELDGAILSTDHYYRSFDDLTLEERKRQNFDAPDSVEHDLLVEHILALKEGRTVHAPIYDFASFSRVGYEPVYPNPILIVEGIFALCWPELNEIADLKVFVDTPESVCLSRRLERDAILRGRTEYESIQRYKADVEPNQIRYIEPTKANSEVMLSGETTPDLNLALIKPRVFSIRLV
jgi:uridine kinase